MNRIKKLAGSKAVLFLGILATVAVGIAAVPGIFSTVNSTSGYLVNSSGGTSGYALCSDGTYYDTPCSVSGTGITALTGPVTASGSGSVATTITATGVTAAAYPDPQFTVNAAGQLTAASNAPHVVLNCLSVSCAGGSTYAITTTYTNSTGRILNELVNMQGTDPTGGCTGPSGLLTGYVNGTPILYTEINNDCNTGNISGFTLPVPPGATFEVTIQTVGSGSSYVLNSWYELPL